MSDNIENTAQATKAVLSSTKIEAAVPETLEQSFKKMFKGAGKISVKPFVDPNNENMGLEEYNMVVFPGITHKEQLAAIERNGVTIFLSGLNEFAPEVQNMMDKEKQEAVKRNIRETVSHLEKQLASNVINPDDPEFWNKVKILKPDNIQFWSSIEMACGNEPVYLNPSKDPYDLIKLMAIEAGGFDLIAKSFEDAQARPTPPKFYLDKEVHTVSTRTNYKKLRNKAISVLDNIASKNLSKLLYMTKVIDGNSTSYKTNTPQDILYDVLDDYINGFGVETNKSKAAQHFIDVSQMDMETLKLKAIVKDASFYRVISLKGDGMLYHTATNTMLGKNVSEVVEYLKNPLYEDMCGTILNEVENHWNN